ncbi:MAG: N-acetylmuramoyl-L-alanine amidase [Nitrospinae bacterium]|nr:N-acetylmuramoyl-L-alanine amidase [Nitrospinota bacterium]
MMQDARCKMQDIRYKIYFLLLVSCLLPLIIVSISAQISDGKENKFDFLYNEARKDYYSLVNSKELQSERANWLNCIFKFESIHKKFPKSHVADKSLFTAARLYAELSNISSDETDIEHSINLFNKITKEYPHSSLADDAQYMIGEIYYKKNNYPQAYSSYNAVIDNYASGDMARQAKSKLSELSKLYQPPDNKSPVTAQGDRLSTVNGIRSWSSHEYTRIVIDVDGSVIYKQERLKNPDRLFIDIHNSKLSTEIKEPISINDGLLKSVRAGQNQKDVVRVVLELDSISSYSIINLNNPFRIVIDVDGSLKREGIGARGKGQGTEEEHQRIPEKTELPLLKSISKIVIDPGHGGKDSGAIGKRSLMEKTVVLDIAKRLKALIEKKTNYEVILTRETDIFIPLEERTVIANIKKADLFISIHANASKKRNAMGIETYFQGIPKTDEARETAARENMSGIDDRYSDDDNILEFILADMRTTHKINESSQLAGVIQDSLIKGVSSRYEDVRNLGVKQAMFYVLHKAKMPSILVETSFISNPEEEKRFRDYRYRDQIANSIYDGIKAYVEKTMVAYRTE